MNGVEMKYDCQNFDRFEIIENTLITYFYKMDTFGFVLSEEELGKDCFDEVITFLCTKLDRI